MIIAEIGINHGGSLEEAISIADTAIDAGAEVIKHQTHVVEDEMTAEARSVIPGNSDRSIYDIMAEAALGEADERALMDHVEGRGAIFISTPFSRAAADRLVGFGIAAYKIGSGECNNFPLVKHVAGFGRPVILSTGMNTMEDIATSVAILEDAGVEYALLHCTNVYPTPSRLVRLGAMTQLAEAFPGAIVGLSDHTTDNLACISAMALGAAIVERHYTDTMEREGPDISCSMDPAALAELKDAAHRITLMRGGSKGPVEEEAATIAFAFASVCTTRPVEVGEPFSAENLWVRRPGTGAFHAREFEGLLGRTAARSLPADHQLELMDVVGEAGG